MICRAATGIHAPDLGTRFSIRSGFSGVCVQTAQPQRCDDTETDSRVDPTLYRRLGIRSILMIPVMRAETLLGLFEIFSPRPSAFSNRDVQTLQALSSRIVDSIAQATEAAAGPPPAEPSPEFPAAPQLILTSRSTGAVVSHDFWTSILNVVVITLALLLGWMVGRAGWQSAMHAGKTQPATSVKPLPSKTDAATVTPSDAAPPNHPAVEPRAPTLASKSKAASKIDSETSPTDGLVIYQNGKVVFRTEPPPKTHQPEIAGASPASRSDTIQLASSTQPQPLPPEIADSYLVKRVEPQYPGPAREQHVQGPVTLDAVVSKDGAVQTLTVVNGDPLLVPAATDAVRQWRFRPYRPSGTPSEFQTRITVNFTLP
jgi:protein TonB